MENTKGIFDFHTHTFLSDGEYGPMETAQRARSRGYVLIGFSDHVDFGTFEDTINKLKKAVEAINRSEMGIKAMVGVEITHVPPSQIREMVQLCRETGAQYTIVHGETPIEPVIKGTNLAAIEAGADILAHPGFITEVEARLAAENGVFLEISARKKQMIANAHVIEMARRSGAPFLVNSDAHEDAHLLTEETLKQLLKAFDIKEEELIANIKEFLKKVSYL